MEKWKSKYIPKGSKGIEHSDMGCQRRQTYVSGDQQAVKKDLLALPLPCTGLPSFVSSVSPRKNICQQLLKVEYEITCLWSSIYSIEHMASPSAFDPT